MAESNTSLSSLAVSILVEILSDPDRLLDDTEYFKSSRDESKIEKSKKLLKFGRDILYEIEKPARSIRWLNQIRSDADGLLDDTEYFKSSLWKMNSFQDQDKMVKITAKLVFDVQCACPRKKQMYCAVGSWIKSLNQAQNDADDLLDENENRPFGFLFDLIQKTKKLPQQFSSVREDMVKLPLLIRANDGELEIVKRIINMARKSQTGVGKRTIEAILYELPEDAEKKCICVRASWFWRSRDREHMFKWLYLFNADHFKNWTGECPRNYFSALETGRGLNIQTDAKLMYPTRNRLSLDNNVSFGSDINLMERLDCDCKMTSLPHDYSTRCNSQKHKETMPTGPMSMVDDTFTRFNQHNREETMKMVSSFVAVSTALVSLLSMIYSYSLLTLSIGFAFFQLVTIVVFVWAVCIMILVKSEFTGMQTATLLFWAIILHIKSGGFITTVYVPMLGIFLVGWFARAKLTAK